jgi:hypothetical protein
MPNRIFGLFKHHLGVTHCIVARLVTGTLSSVNTELCFDMHTVRKSWVSRCLRRLSSVMQETSVLVYDSAKHVWHCDFDTAAAVQCPPNYFKRSQTQITDGCASMGIPCKGEWCICDPCMLGEKINVFLSLSKRCSKPTQNPMPDTHQKLL